ncbi:interleukin-9 [Alligator sinensis]|uniref:Interleukin-9 n=1 Tax=Alligator sinensis TaxID=38654 RepID=A0A3Q0G091_ALLSI|nr:interleukin-9 [Alligator sinensis]
MLLYILFSCLLLVVQARTICRVRETIDLTNTLLGKLEDCECNETNHNSCICLPIPNNACLTCFEKHNEEIEEKLSTIGSEGRRLYRSLQQLQNWKLCAPLFTCTETCDASPGNMMTFLTSVRAALQKLQHQ